MTAPTTEGAKPSPAALIAIRVLYNPLPRNKNAVPESNAETARIAGGIRAVSLDHNAIRQLESNSNTLEGK